MFEILNIDESFNNQMLQIIKETPIAAGSLKLLFDKYSSFGMDNFKLQTLSMGMSSDYKIAIDEGSTMVRIGSLLFGKRRKG